jgi:kynureninase
VFAKLAEHGVVVDFREPDVIRAAPVPLYNTFEDVWVFADELKRALFG